MVSHGKPLSSSSPDDPPLPDRSTSAPPAPAAEAAPAAAPPAPLIALALVTRRNAGRSSRATLAGGLRGSALRVRGRRSAATPMSLRGAGGAQGKPEDGRTGRLLHRSSRKHTYECGMGCKQPHRQATVQHALVDSKRVAELLVDHVKARGQAAHRHRVEYESLKLPQHERLQKQALWGKGK